MVLGTDLRDGNVDISLVLMFLKRCLFYVFSSFLYVICFWSIETKTSKKDKLNELKELLDEELISNEEYEESRKKILAQ